jgi:hypothetical protein
MSGQQKVTSPRIRRTRNVSIADAKKLTDEQADFLAHNKTVIVEKAVRQGDPRIEIVKEAEEWGPIW